jgi:hypothetical protein
MRAHLSPQERLSPEVKPLQERIAIRSTPTGRNEILSILSLQRSAGNRAIAAFVQSLSAQRCRGEGDTKCGCCGEDKESKTPVQRMATEAIIQRSGGPAGECSGGVCATQGNCAIPDTGQIGTPAESTRWELELNIDIEASDWESALRNQSFGHAYVRFWESNGRQYTYGFYPAGTLPNENRRSVPGCVHHPDTTHNSCVDDVVGYTLTRDQYERGLRRAQEVCAAGGSYGQANTCATFAADVVRAAGQAPPSSRSQETTVFYQHVPPIDNPNTMSEWVHAARSLTSDSEIRDWVTNQSNTTLSSLPTSEVIRLISRLLKGWISDDDVAAVEHICRALTSGPQMSRVRSGVAGSVDGMNTTRQKDRVNAALARTP